MKLAHLPPDYYDVNGDGRVSSFDALLVVNFLNDRINLGQGEQIAPEAEFATTTNYATPVTTGLPSGNVMAAPAAETPRVLTQTVARDALFSAGVSVSAGAAAVAENAVIPADQAASEQEIDDALSSLLDDLTDSELSSI